jgi:RND family efflux transporter MFP subunit
LTNAYEAGPTSGKRLDRRSRRERAKSIVPGVAFLAILSLAGCDEPAFEAQDIARSVKTIVVGERAAMRERQLAGVLEAERSSELSFAVSGTVAEVLVEEGMDVVADQVLARLDTRIFELALSGARASLVSARAELEEQQLNFERQRTLFAKDIVARAALDRAQAALTTARAKVSAAQSEVAAAQRDLDRTALNAPFDGRIAARLIEPFQEVAVGAPIFAFESAKGLDARILVPETMIRQIAYGDAVQLSFPTLPDARLGGTVVKIGSRMEAGNAFPISVRLQASGNPVAGELRSGMTVRATFDLARGQLEPGYLIPLSAIALGEGAAARPVESRNAGDIEPSPQPASVFVFDETAGVVRKVSVLAGDLRGNMVEVYEGLSPDDRVVVAGVAFLRDGMPARLWTPDL